MGSTENGRSERRITAPWCGSRVAGWRVVAGKTAVLMGVITLLASEASLVSLVRKWNAMVPRLEMVLTHRKLDTNVTAVTVASALTALLKQLTLEASRAPEDSVTSMAPMVTMASMASMVASMASLALRWRRWWLRWWLRWLRWRYRWRRWLWLRWLWLPRWFG